MKNKKEAKIKNFSSVKTDKRYVLKFSIDNHLRILFYKSQNIKKIGLFAKLKERFKKKAKKTEKETYKPIVDSSVERFYPKAEFGLSQQQVESREKANLLNNSKVTTSKTYLSIIIKNLFTFFNMIWLIIAISLICVGSYEDLIFIFIIVANTAIAIIQEIRAKIAVEKLSIVVTPMVKTIRYGKISDTPADKLVLDDVIILQSGNQIPADCKILSGKVEVNESLLTGESNAIEKTENSVLLAGSFIVSGQCYARVDKIGSDNYINLIAKKAKEFKAPESNLFKDLNRLIKYIGIALVPIGVLTFLKEFMIKGSTIQEQITKTSGALTSMIPSGMFLLVTISLAIAVVKLSKKKTLVRDLYSIEMLARTNVLCLDKTGTITDGTMKVVDFITFSNKRKSTIKKMLSNVLHVQKTMNATANAMIKEFGRNDEFKALNIAEFSSQRKFSITQLSNHKIYFLGASTMIGCPLNAEQNAFIRQQQSKGYRVLAFAELENEMFDKNMNGQKAKLLGFIVIEETIREDAIETIQWFKDNGVEIKIISGDDPSTVSRIAQRVGVQNSEKFISLEGVSLQEVEKLAEDFTVFGRVTPEQKYTIIKALKNKGKVVAMTGDGVNDTLALKEADCSIAMADGSDVARSISKIVLLESNFSSLPSIVKEGRQVVNNVQNSSSLFLMKTFFAISLTIITLFLQIQYPFDPSMMILLEFFVIGMPSFLLTFEPNTKHIKGNFIPQVMKRALPRAFLLLINVLIVMIIFYTQPKDPEILTANEYITLAILTLSYTGFLNLASFCIPPTLIKLGVAGLSLVSMSLAIVIIPKMFNILNISHAVLTPFFAIIAVSVLIIAILKLNHKRIDVLRQKIVNILHKQKQ